MSPHALFTCMLTLRKWSEIAFLTRIFNQHDQKKTQCHTKYQAGHENLLALTLLQLIASIIYVL